MKNTLQIHSENILPIIKKWLYSDRDIFARELISNASDAIQKVKILRDKEGITDAQEQDFRIDVTIDKASKTLTFADNGIGMDASEVEKYIAQIAFSGAEDFVQQYKTDMPSDEFIGHFGLGFYSSYMVADKVQLDTLSYKKNSKPAFWSCDGTNEYTLEEGQRTKRGTTITLFISKDSEEFLDEAHLMEILRHYCGFMPYPIFLNDKRINTKDPLWMKTPAECKESDYLEFYRHLYPMEEAPLFWMHLNVDYPFHLKGILYFPRIGREFDFVKNSVKLYCNRVFVSDNCKDLIPEYLMVLRGVIDSPDIPLNVSRSYLQSDRTTRQLSQHISKKVSDSLSNLYKADKARYEGSWKDISPIIKLGAVQDEKFYERIHEYLIWKTLDGLWLNLAEYAARNDGKIKGKVLYTFDPKQSGHLNDLYKSRAIDVLVADPRLDPYLFQTLERKNKDQIFTRMDAELGDHLLDKDKEKQILDAEGKTEAGRLADFYRQHINGEWEIEAKSLASTELPAFVVIQEQERRLRDHFRAIDPEGVLAKQIKKKLIVNTNNPLIHQVAKLQDQELAKELSQEIVEMSLLAQKEIDANTLHAFVKRTAHILEKLTSNK